MQLFRNLNPEKVWEYFGELLAIPRPSKKEEKIVFYLKSFAEKHKLKYKQDKVGNTLITKPATQGYERKKTLVLQSHVDMVCEKNEESSHNFETDAIHAYLDDGWIKAKGTTLGADNGIGVAVQLAILAERDIDHGPLECLFTVDEETGMTGAHALQSDFLSGNLLLNLDSEDEGEIYIGCAGGIDTLIALPVKYHPLAENVKSLSLRVRGLLGGHSGDDIHKARGNAMKILGRLLWNLSQEAEFSLCAIEGGNVRNAIPRESTAVIAFDRKIEKRLMDALNQQIAIIRAEYVKEPDLSITTAPVDQPGMKLENESQKNLLCSLHACPNGVIEMSQNIPGLVETSSNLASIHASGAEEITVITSQRSSVESAKYDIASRIRSLWEMAGARVTHSDSYPGWSPNPGSELVRLTEASYKRLFGASPAIKAIHAGLECGLFLEKYPRLDMVSIGPTIKGAHSPDERMEVKSVEKFWNLVLDIMKSVPEETE